MNGMVYLIGAGCGSYDLITIRGQKLLSQCDTVVYDSLIDLRLLDFVPECAEKICVGKRAGQHNATQNEINQLLIQKASEGKTVARLKGGDPFVFGRGGEEILALQAHGIPYNVVPGISSAIAVPELAGIPVTHRKTSRSFHVITGHTADEIMPENLRHYARLDGTLVFLMGLKHLRQITENLLSGGMHPDTPAAVISQGGTARQRTMKGTLGSIASLAEQNKAEAPAVIVIGETACFDFSPDLPLENASVAVTGTKRFTDKLSQKLESLGASVRCCCKLEIREYAENPMLDKEIAQLAKYKWLVFTSMNGVDIFLKRLRKNRIDIRSLSGLHIAVLGSGTANALAQYGLFPELIPEEYTSAALGKALAQKASGNILILRAKQGSPELTKPLDAAGISYDDVKIYDVSCQNDFPGEAVQDDFLVFASASGVHAFFDNGNTISGHTRIICIGQITADALHSHGVTECSICAVHTVDGIVQKILEGKHETIQKAADK